jgi:hypothetical protein
LRQRVAEISRRPARAEDSAQIAEDSAQIAEVSAQIAVSVPHR